MKQLDKEKRMQILKDEFKDIDKDKNGYLSKEELFEFMNSQTTQIDQDVSEQIWDQMDKNNDGKIAVEEFIRVFMKAEDILREKISIRKKYISNYETQKEEAKLQLEELKETENFNQHGVMNGSSLDIIVVEAFNIQSKQNQASLYLQLSVNDEVNEISSQIENAKNKKWNFQCKLTPIESKEQMLSIKILDNEDVQKSNILGKVDISLNQLYNQQKKDEWYDLLECRSKGKIHLILRWIHSKTKFFSDLIKQFEEQISKNIEEMQEFEQDLTGLYKPFKLLREAYSSDENQEKIKTLNDYIPKQLKEHKYVKIAHKHLNKYEWSNISFKLSYVILFLSILCLFNKSQYMDVNLYLVCLLKIVLHCSLFY